MNSTEWSFEEKHNAIKKVQRKSIDHSAVGMLILDSQPQVKKFVLKHIILGTAAYAGGGMNEQGPEHLDTLWYAMATFSAAILTLLGITSAICRHKISKLQKEHRYRLRMILGEYKELPEVKSDVEALEQQLIC